MQLPCQSQGHEVCRYFSLVGHFTLMASFSVLYVNYTFLYLEKITYRVVIVFE